MDNYLIKNIANDQATLRLKQIEKEKAQLGEKLREEKKKLLIIQALEAGKTKEDLLTLGMDKDVIDAVLIEKASKEAEDKESKEKEEAEQKNLQEDARKDAIFNEVQEIKILESEIDELDRYIRELELELQAQSLKEELPKSVTPSPQIVSEEIPKKDRDYITVLTEYNEAVKKLNDKKTDFLGKRVRAVKRLKKELDAFPPEEKN